MLDLSKGGNKPLPTARALAQMRILTQPKGLPDGFADAMARAGLTPTMADSVTAGLVALVEHSKTFGVDLADWQKLAEDLIAKSGPNDPATAPAATPTALAGQIVMAHLAAKDALIPVSRGGGDVRVGRSWDGGQGMQARMADGLLARMMPGHKPTMGAEFAGMALSDLAEMSLRNSGERGIGYLSASRKITMAAGHTTSDFSIALGNSVNRVLLQAYEAAQSAIKTVSHEGLAKDFRPITNVRFSAGLELLPYSEGGEIKHGTLNEGGETLSVAKYGKMFNISLEALSNDDLGVFARMGTLGGTGAALTEAKLFASLVTQASGAGPTLSDGNALFHANHGNLSSTSTAITVAALNLGMTAMRRQTGPSGEKINVVPRYLLVAPEKEAEALQMVTQITPALSSSVNPFAGKLEVLVDPNLVSATRWYLVAAPGMPEGLRHVYLEGHSGPQVDSQWDFNSDMLQFRVRSFFGCGFADWRGWWTNPGA